jgi:hypothetical protein
MDKRYYNDVKNFVDKQISNIDFRLVDKFKDRPFDWAATFLPLVSRCIEQEDYEGAKAVSDSIKGFLNRFLPDKDQIPIDAKLKLPKVEQAETKGVICFVDGKCKLIRY